MLWIISALPVLLVHHSILFGEWGHQIFVGHQDWPKVSSRLPGFHGGQFYLHSLSLPEVIADRVGTGFLDSGGNSLEPGPGSLEQK